MPWKLLPVDYTDASWEGLKRYILVNNEDNTVSLQDVTNYSNKENSFFGAKDANRMNEALNTIMSMVENGTSLYEAFQNYFNDQKTKFEGEATKKQTELTQYVDDRKADADKTIESIKTDYKADIESFETAQQLSFTTWFEAIRGQLSQDPAGHLQNQVDGIQVDISALKAKKIIDDSQLSSTLTWSSEKINNTYKVDNVKLNYTIQASAYQNVEQPTTKKKFYADVPCTKSKVTMNCQISPADSVEDVSLLTYAEPMEGKVRCYFMEKPVEPYVIESIEFTNVVQSEELQAQSVYEQEMATYMIWKEQHDKEVAEAQKAIAEAKAREEAQKEQRLATMESNIRNVEQASAGMAEAVNDMKPKVSYMATRAVEMLVDDYVTSGAELPADIMDLAEPNEWAVGHAYKKGDLITYESKTGFVKQDHTSQANWIPFTTGTEALYGARPKAVNGVYPYVYNMALEVGMIVEHNGIKYRAIQDANELLYEPAQVPALLEVIKDAN